MLSAELKHFGFIDFDEPRDHVINCASSYAENVG